MTLMELQDSSEPIPKYNLVFFPPTFPSSNDSVHHSSTSVTLPKEEVSPSGHEILLKASDRAWRVNETAFRFSETISFILS